MTKISSKYRFDPYDVALAMAYYPEKTQDPDEMPTPLGLVELRAWSLVAIGAPRHNPRAALWLSPRSRMDLKQRIFGQSGGVKGEKDSLLHLTSAVDRLPEEKPVLPGLNAVPPFYPDRLSVGVENMLREYRGAIFWPKDHIFLAIANWWGMEVTDLKRWYATRGYYDELEGVSMEVADLLGVPREVYPQFPEVKKEVTRVMDEPVDGSMIDKIISAGCRVLNEALWQKRFREDGNLSYEARIASLSTVFGIEESKLSGMLSPRSLLAIGRKDPCVADWIGYDPLSRRVQIAAEPLNVPTFSSGAYAYRRELKIAGINVYENRGDDYYDIMDRIGNGFHPYPAVYASLHYRAHFTHDYQGTKIGRFIGPPPLPAFRGVAR